MYPLAFSHRQLQTLSAPEMCTSMAVTGGRCLLCAGRAGEAAQAACRACSGQSAGGPGRPGSGGRAQPPGQSWPHNGPVRGGADAHHQGVALALHVSFRVSAGWRDLPVQPSLLWMLLCKFCALAAAALHVSCLFSVCLCQCSTCPSACSSCFHGIYLQGRHFSSSIPIPPSSAKQAAA